MSDGEVVTEEPKNQRRKKRHISQPIIINLQQLEKNDKKTKKFFNNIKPIASKRKDELETEEESSNDEDSDFDAENVMESDFIFENKWLVTNCQICYSVPSICCFQMCCFPYYLLKLFCYSEAII
jgi:hypothetical protein